MVIITTASATIILEFDKLVDDMKSTISHMVDDLHDDLVSSTPVDSGEMRDSWTKPSFDGNWTWSFKNTSDHAVIIARGRRRLPNQNGTVRWYGSIQNGWSAGVRPFMKRFERKLIVKLNNI